VIRHVLKAGIVRTNDDWIA